MPQDDHLRSKDEVQDKIHLVVADENSPEYRKSNPPRVLFALSPDAAKQVNELPADEFLNLLDQSSPEQIEQFLQALGPSKKPILKELPKLLGYLIQIPDEPRGAFSIIAWWESRRIVFNLVVGLCGLPTLAILYFSGLADLSFLVKGTIEYAFLANLCYTAGWMNELVARSWWKERARHLGPILFSLGFAFSILLTLGAGIIAILIFLLLGLCRGLL